MELKIPPSASYEYAVARIKAWARKKTLLRRSPKPDSITIMGAYNCRNIGDLSLGMAARQGLTGNNLTLDTTFHDIYDHTPAKIGNTTIVAGGAVGTRQLIEKIQHVITAHPSAVHLAGIQFSENISHFGEPTIRFLQQVGSISVRSHRQLEVVKRAIGREDVEYTPDLSFLFARHTALDTCRQEKHIGFNASPFFASKTKNRFGPRNRTSKSMAEARTLAKSYIDQLRQCLQNLSSAGHKITHFPFTPEDDAFARSAFQSNEIIFARYTTNPISMLSRLSQMRKFIATRYHAHIFAIVTQTPVISLNVSRKSQDLIADLNFSESDVISLNDLHACPANSVTKLTNATGFVLSPPALDHLSEAVGNHLSCITRESVEGASRAARH